MPSSPIATAGAKRWDVFCRVVDNHGDIGVCWRLAADLAARGHRVRLWVDDASALAWMAPQGAPGVSVRGWPTADDTLDGIEPADVVVEAFGCDLPASFLRRMASRARPPCWVNLEYLSAEAYVERCHRLPSPQLAGPAQGLTKFFFYPGFTPRTGGLLREPGLLQRRQRFDAAAWLAARGCQRQPAERLVSVFAYDNPRLPELLQALASQPTRLLLAPGPLAEAVEESLSGAAAPHPHLHAQRLPYLRQVDYDHLLWSCDFNLVRGEDSFVRAQWAGAPFLWQIYPQDDGAHGPKLQAFLRQFLEGAPPGLAGPVAAWHERWNGLSGEPAPALPDLGAWSALSARWQARQAAQDDLATQLIRLASEQR